MHYIIWRKAGGKIPDKFDMDAHLKELQPLNNIIIPMNKIVIDIALKQLTVYNSRSVLKTYPVITGRNSHLGHKEKEGDQRTPRGDYYVCTINEKSKFTLFFGLSYPNTEDAKGAFLRGVIDEKQRDGIISAITKEARPPWNTPMGGEIGIHGGGIGRDGTRGCIGMRDEDVLDLRRFVEMGMTVEIR